MNTMASPRSVETLLANVSASRLATFHQCRLKFYFQYVLGLPRAKSAALHVGTTLHATLQYWNKARWRRLPLEHAQLQQAFEESWVEEQKDQPIVWEEDEEKEVQAHAWSLLKTYLEQTPIPVNERPEGVEVAVEADLSLHGLPKLTGIIDLVRAGGRIVDFKTAAQTPSQDKAIHLHETQLSCYALMYREATGHREGGLEIHHLIKLKQPKIMVTVMDPMTDRQQTRLFRLLESYQQGVDRKDWVHNPGPMACACCEYFQACRRW